MPSFEWPKDTPDWLIQAIDDTDEQLQAQLANVETEALMLAKVAGGIKALRGLREAAEIAKAEQEAEHAERVRRFAEGK